MKTKIIILIIGITISFAFVSCEKDKDKKNPTTTQTSTTYSVKYNVIGGEQAEYYSSMVITICQSLQYSRNDTYLIGGIHYIFLYNQACRLYSNGNWNDYQYKPSYDIMGEAFSKMNPTTTRVILGRTCNVYVIQGTEAAVWNKILMYYSDDAITFEAIDINFEVPENAFSEETINVDWI